MKSQEGSKAAERLNGSEILVRALAEEGVEYVFGYPGGSVLNIFDAIYKQDKFKHILVRHEQAAAHEFAEQQVGGDFHAANAFPGGDGLKVQVADGAAAKWR